MNPRRIFGGLVDYLLSTGWYRVGDDLGVWYDRSGAMFGFGDAVQTQLERDGVSMLELP